MKIAFFTDPHWSLHSSIVRGKGSRYSVRLENLIKSLNWVEQVAWSSGCSAIICGGDFFDSTQLNSEEISALKEIQWTTLPHIFITGNHESNVSSLEFTTSDIFSLCPSATVITAPEYHMMDEGKIELAFLPYILEKDRQPLSQYFPKRTTRRIIFSHNDLKDVQYGPFLSTEGFTVDEIHAECDLFMNGHIHHCGYVSPTIINGGNLTGQNFTEDATKYEHCIQLIDTDTLHVDFYINPYALNFYKLDCTCYTDLKSCIDNVFIKMKSNSVITVKVNDSLVRDVREYLDSLSKDILVEYRIISESDASSKPEKDLTVSMEAVDHLKQFENYVLTNIGNSSVVIEELQKVLR